MKRTNLRRAVSGVLSFAITATTILGDFTVPTNVFASEDTSVSSESSLDDYSEGSGSITSEYIAANLDGDLGSEAAALNADAAYAVAEEYLLSEAASSGNDVESVIVSEDITESEESIEFEDSIGAGDSDSTDIETGTDTVTDDANVIIMETAETVSASGNDAEPVGVSSNDAGIATLSLDDTVTSDVETADAETVETEATESEAVVTEVSATEVTETEEADVTVSETEETETEVTVSEEEIAALAEEILDSTAEIETVDDYDTNGLATVYHYILLNCTLVDADYVWDGMTNSDIWSEAPDSFIASYLTTINVYTLEDNEDYYVALVDPAALNGLGGAIYADFTNLDTENPISYNDIITFDADTGLIYIPKSFYYDENGDEVTKELEAQVLVPYSMDQEESSISVSVTSEMDGVEGISGTYSVPTLDVTTTFQIVDAEDADKISLDDICVSINDDVLPFDASDGNALYDTETGELTISASPNTVYSVSVVISEDVSATEESDETLAFLEQRNILIASADDDLSGLLVADSSTSYSYANEATTVAGMKAVPNTTVTLTSGTLAAGQKFNYTGHWATNLSSEASIVNAVIAETAIYSYYAWDSNPMLQNDGTYHATYIDDSNYSDIIFDSSGNISYSSSGEIKHLYVAASNSSYHYAYNRMVSLPNNQQLTSTDGNATTSWSASCFSGNSNYSNYIAVHCTEIINDTTHGYSGTDTLTVRVLYVSSSYMVFSISVPLSYTQAGSGVFKVALEGNTKDYYARFGVRKVNAENTSTTLSGATFAYCVSNTFDISVIDDYAKATARVASNVASNSAAATSVIAGLKTNGFPVTGTITTSTGNNFVTLNNKTNSVLADYGSQGYVWVYVTEVIPPDGYERNTNVWALRVSVSETNYSYSKITTAYYYTVDSSSYNITGSSSASYNSSYGYFTVQDTPLDTYGALNLVKTSTSSSSTYVGGAVYALIETGAGISYSNYVSMAKTAYNANKTDSAAAFKAFYEAMQDYSGGDLSGYIVGAYTTNSSSTSAELKAVSSTGTISSTSTVLDFGTSSQKKYVLVEVWTPAGYTLDSSYYAFRLNSNGNTSTTYSDAVEMTTMVTSTSDSSTAPIHQTSGSTATSSNTWSTYASTAGNYKGATLQLKIKDKAATYYGAMNLIKKNSSGSYVGGAVYALIATGAGIGYDNYVDMATAAYEANTSSASDAFAAFYENMKNYSGGDLTGYIVGAYTTTGGSAVKLKAVNSDGTISSSDKVINFGTQTQKRFVLVEVWTPSSYTLDDSYYSFCLNNNKNESSTYSTAVKKTTMITRSAASSTDTYPFHQNAYGEYKASLDTWDDYATIVNNSTSTELQLTVMDNPHYYAALNLNKVSQANKSTYVEGAVYVLIETGSGASYSEYVDMAQAAYAAHPQSATAAMNAFYSSMHSVKDNAGEATLDTYVRGAYVTTGTSTTAKLCELSNGFTNIGDEVVLDFGTKSEKRYVLVEVWTPEGYTLDEQYYAFYLKANGNTSTTYDTAAKKTTLCYGTDDSNHTPLHQASGTYANSTNTWDSYVTVTGGSSTSTTLSLKLSDPEETYYGGFRLVKKSSEDDSTYVGNALYVLIDTTDMSSTELKKSRSKDK